MPAASVPDWKRSSAAAPSRFDARDFDVDAVLVDDGVPPGCTARRSSWKVREYLATNTTYFRLHATYFVALGFLGGGAVWGAEAAGAQPVPFVDALFHAFSAACVTGLYTLDMSSMTVASQVITLALILLGGTVLLSAVPVLIRRRYFDRHASAIARDATERQELLDSTQAEYGALGWVVSIVFTYWAAVQALTILLLGLYCSNDAWAGSVLAARGIHPWWFATFMGISSFGNAGFSLLQDNLIPFHNNAYVLLVLSASIMLGNVGYPIMFRAIVWGLHKRAPRDEGLKLLLDRPRKCFTHMFRAPQTRVLVLILLIFTLLEYILFLGLDWNEPWLSGTDEGSRALIGFFSAVSTRTAGFNVIDLSLLAPSMQILYGVMMYLSVVPVVLSMRKSTDTEAQEKVIMDEVSAAGVILDPGYNASSVEDEDGSLHSGRGAFVGVMAGEAVAIGADGRLAPMPTSPPPPPTRSLGRTQTQRMEPEEAERSAAATAFDRRDRGERAIQLRGITEEDGERDGEARDATSHASDAALPTHATEHHVSPRRVSHADVIAARRGGGALPPGGLLNLPGDGFPVQTPDIAVVRDDYVSSDEEGKGRGKATDKGGPTRPPRAASTRGRVRARAPEPAVGTRLAFGGQAAADSSESTGASSGEAMRSAAASAKGAVTAESSSEPPVGAPPAVDVTGAGGEGAVSARPPRKRFAREVMSESTLDLPQAGLSFSSSSDVNVGGLVIEDEASKGVLRAGREVLTRETPLLLLALFVMAIAESGAIKADRGRGAAISIWSITFEIVSAFGTVGLSLGYPGSPLSLSGRFTVFSKLVIIAVMLAGRHRGLPHSIDPAVHLPSLLNKKPKRGLGGFGGSFSGSFADLAQASVRSFLPPTSSLRMLGLTEDRTPALTDRSDPGQGGMRSLGQGSMRSLGRGVSFVNVPGAGASYFIPLPQATAGRKQAHQLAALGRALSTGTSFSIPASQLSVSSRTLTDAPAARPPLGGGGSKQGTVGRGARGEEGRSAGERGPIGAASLTQERRRQGQGDSAGAGVSTGVTHSRRHLASVFAGQGKGEGEGRPAQQVEIEMGVRPGDAAAPPEPS